ncbi:Eukaryotic translation initiation factor 3 subunit K [Trichophyton interdigitale]|uniref:Eukaryotic translation initiation factor 3 subunit K n=1 Tax=Trichophyton interdigitale TaxID=101480 RepID=A0A9P4YI24_9EURO|nr:Eukaryotic translation initiation factor 3 subunit K [Trichophyton interdigitale]KAF3898310.1 Eukaryotic translation initiation factor 3 subunit K [Trichophyton interdigitale]KAG8210393.1 Eukaryotic translation initiation factor 3 subunit K [Trichophyton interdigitale]
MSTGFDKCKTRPPHMDAILNGLDRYNPETTTVFQDYVVQQCEDRTFDCYANLALLKLYQFNPHLLNIETTTNILVKALTVFPSPAFSLSLALLPAYTQPFHNSAPAQGPSATLPIQTADFVESVQKLARLSTLLESAQYSLFWSTLNSDDLYADLIADVAGFEELIRVRIAVEVGKAFREISAEMLMDWLDVKGLDTLEKFVVDVCGWEVDKSGASGVNDAKNVTVRVPRNKENEARGEVKGEKVGIEMFGRVIRRGFEQPA